MTGAVHAVDVADLTSAEQIDALMASLRTGFVYVHHPLTPGLLEEAYAVVRRFFALDLATKERYRPERPAVNAGYRGLQSEQAVGAGLADWKETFQWCTQLPPGHPLRERFPERYPERVLPDADVSGAGDALLALHAELLACQHAVLQAISLGLGGSPLLADDLLADADVVTRALHYPPQPAGGPAPLPWAGEHVDINLLTVLPPASSPGLQIATAEGWIAAEPPPDHLVLNTGIMLERLSNGGVSAGRHRVVAGADPKSLGGSRFSLVQFLHPAPWTVVAPLAATVRPDNPQSYGGILAGDLLARTLAAIRR